MTHPLTPREKVAAALDPEIWADDMPVPTRAAVTDFHARRQASTVKADTILTALASGSCDHAELARLAEAATPGPWSAADWDDDFGENKFTVQATEPEKLSPGQSSIWPGGIRCLRIAETMEGQRPTEDAAFIAAANPATVLALLAENAALRAACSKSNDEISQTLGKALGYPWFKDDQINFPGATAENGVCVGDHVAESLADEAARRISEAERKLAEAVGLLREMFEDGPVEVAFAGNPIACAELSARCTDFLSKEAERG